MSRSDLLNELHSYCSVLRAPGVLPEEVDAHYQSWATVQYGESGESFEGDVLLISGRWLHIFKTGRNGISESVTQEVVPLSSVKGIDRTLSGNRGFDDSDVYGTAEKYSVVIRIAGRDPITLPLRHGDYNNEPSAWKSADALINAILAYRAPDSDR